MIECTQRLCTALAPQAATIQQWFQASFNLFGKCHCLYSSNEISAEDIDTLGRHSHSHVPVLLYLDCLQSKSFPDANIKAFMSHYRENFPHATVLPKCALWKSTWSHVWRCGKLAWWESKEQNPFMWTSTQFKEATNPYPTRWIDCVALCMSTTSALPPSTSLYSLQPSATRQRRVTFDCILFHFVFHDITWLLSHIPNNSELPNKHCTH